MSVFVINPFVYYIPPWVYGGSSNAYLSGGLNPPATRLNTHRRFSMVSDGSDINVGTLSPLATNDHTGAHSKQDGYYMGGLMPPSTSGTTDVKKFPFATNVNTLSVLGLSAGRRRVLGCSSETSGYALGGQNPTPPHSTVMDKFPFATNVNATNIGALVFAKREGSGHSSPTHGYVAGGQGNPPVPSATTNVQRFPFATDTNAATYSALATSRYLSASVSSEINGYTCGGRQGGPNSVAGITRIERFPFTTNTPAVLNGSLSGTGRAESAGASSTTTGYTMGGIDGATLTNIAVRDKFPFATNTPATAISDLASARTQHASVHV